MPFFEGTPMHEYYKELARKEVLQEYEQAYQEERQMHLQIQSNTLLMIVQARFPTLVELAKEQAGQIKVLAIIDEVLGKVGAAQTIEEAEGALLNCQPSDDAEK